MIVQSEAQARPASRAADRDPDRGLPDRRASRVLHRLRWSVILADNDHDPPEWLLRHRSATLP
jgi:hypothetical protein